MYAYKPERGEMYETAQKNIIVNNLYSIVAKHYRLQRPTGTASSGYT